jgi:phosphatidylserine decarboxylase
MKNTLFIAFQYLIPQHMLSRLVGFFARTEISFVKTLLIKQFIKKFNVNMDEAEKQFPEEFKHFNDFFTRALKANARTIDSNTHSIASPADGVISQIGEINSLSIVQTKGHHYSLSDLLGGNAETTELFKNGHFSTIYLSPKDYHRLHMPITGTLKETIYIPGDLFSVNQATTEHVPNLFARNERVIAIFDTQSGPMALVLVGAMIVAGIETVWQKAITPPSRIIKRIDHSNLAITIEKGQEMGRFYLGSTIVMCFAHGALTWDEKLTDNAAIQMGESMGALNI